MIPNDHEHRFISVTVAASHSPMTRRQIEEWIDEHLVAASLREHNHGGFVPDLREMVCEVCLQKQRQVAGSYADRQIPI